MMCTTVLHGGVCHRTSTSHKSGNKMKEKKKKRYWNTVMNSLIVPQSPDFDLVELHFLCTLHQVPQFKFAVFTGFILVTKFYSQQSHISLHYNPYSGERSWPSG